MKLSERHCENLPEGTPALAGEALRVCCAEVGAAWTVESGKKLTREFGFPDFVAALAFVNRVGAVAEAENHHPDVFLSWGKVRVTWWTHTVGGLSENDFICAAKINACLEP